tara:strand:- start:2659 stop:3246 length:588 start_codon:yes stop_codon:yes gene_type:complete
MRTNKVILLVGTRGVGKTDYLKPLVKNSNLPKRLIIDTFDSPVWQNLETHNKPEWRNTIVPIVEMNHLKNWNSGTYRCFSADTKQMMSVIQKEVTNAFIIFEDATKYVRSNLQDDVRKFVLDSKQKNLDLIFVFHALASIPRELARIADVLVIKKTNEALDKTLKNKFPVASFIPAFNEVKDSPDRYKSKAILLN